MDFIFLKHVGETSFSLLFYDEVNCLTPQHVLHHSVLLPYGPEAMKPAIMAHASETMGEKKGLLLSCFF